MARTMDVLPPGERRLPHEFSNEMIRLSYRKLHVIAQVMFWLSYFGFVMMTFSSFLSPEAALVRALMMVVINGLLVYVHLYYLMPRFLERERYGTYLLGLLGLVVVVGGLRLMGDQGLVWFFGKRRLSQMAFLQAPFSDLDAILDLVETLYRESESEVVFFRKLVGVFFMRRVTSFLNSSTHVGTIVIASLLLILITLPLRLMELWHQQQNQRQRLESQRLEAELKFLKTQVNPHFLFNTLNNVYTLAVMRSERTPTMIMKLSEMMRYMIYDSAAERVPLEGEVAYLHNYIALQQLKTPQPQQIEFRVQGKLGGWEVPPLLFVPLFENAFKHGMLERVEQGWLKAELRVGTRELHFFMENNYEVHSQKDKLGGIGLDNIRQRLALTYPSRHTLDIESSGGCFRLRLCLRQAG